MEYWFGNKSDKLVNNLKKNIDICDVFYESFLECKKKYPDSYDKKGECIYAFKVYYECVSSVVRHTHK